MIDVYASQPNYWRHLAPIVRELCQRGHEVRTGASTLGRPWGDRIDYAPETDLLLVASWVDARRWDWVRCAYVEHGAGQTYETGNDRQDGYAGARGLDNVVLFLTPNDVVAQRWRERYPQAVAVTVGCPALDVHLARDSERSRTMSVVGARYNLPSAAADDERTDDLLRLRGAPVVAVTSHWSCGIVPETMPVLPFYEAALRSLVSDGAVRVVGHAHPRATQRAETLWRRLGVTYEADPDVILQGADLLVADNTSLMYEAAAIDLPVLALNWPWNPKQRTGYRRDVEHGLRFWSHVPGLECAGSDELAVIRELPVAIERAIADPPEARQLRARAAARAYAHRDGHSAARAADAIEALLA